MKSLTWLVAAILLSAAMLGGCSRKPSDPGAVAVAPRAGGATTIDDATSNAFSTPAPNLSGGALTRHLEGDVAFEAAFVAAPAQVNTGLGPVFNNNACVACHPRDGRGRPPLPGEQPQSMFLRISLPGTHPDGSGGPNPVDGFGTQLFDKAVFGTLPLGQMAVSYTEQVGRFADGEMYSLRAPQYTIIDTYRELPSGVMMSPRVAPPIFGRGLLEALSESDILKHADPGDADGDGVSGRPNYVWNVARGFTELGRFGLKAGNPNLLQQAASAYRGDIGITTPFFPLESSHGLPPYDGLNDDPELDLQTLEAVTFYTQTLAVPARRDVSDPRVRQGERLFERANCVACHVPRMETGILPGVPEVSAQVIYPYSDMLLHDMGEGLADGRPEFLAEGNEWRTPPLWGIGLTYLVNGHTFFLHDGRARNVEEAILWHGGEAEGSRTFYIELEESEREALQAFLNSL